MITVPTPMNVGPGAEPPSTCPSSTGWCLLHPPGALRMSELLFGLASRALGPGQSILARSKRA